MKINTGRKVAPRRILFYGIAGVGKSSWAAQAPGAIFLNIEDGLADIDCNSTDPLRSFDDVIGAINWLTTEEHSFRTVVVDTLDWVEKLIFRDIASQAGKESISDIEFNRGYDRAEPKWKLFLDFLEGLRANRRMSVILLAHSRVQKFQDPIVGTYDRHVPDLYVNNRGEGPINTIMEWCDEILFASFKTFTKTEGKGFNERKIAVGGKERYIRTCESASCLAKNRLGLPEEIEMDFEVYANAVREKAPKKAQGNIAGIVVNGSSKPEKQRDAELEKQAAEAF